MMNAGSKKYEEAPHDAKRVQGMADDAPDIPAIAYRFEDPDSYIVPSTCRLVLYLPAEGARGRPIRLLEHVASGASAKWHVVEIYFIETDRWIGQHVCANDAEAYAEARALRTGFEDREPVCAEARSH